MTAIKPIIDLSAVKEAKLYDHPYPYTVIPQLINVEYLSDLVASFPEIDHRGSIPPSAVKCLPLFQQFVTELEGTLLRNIIAEKFSLDLDSKPTMLTLRGYTTERDGHIHTDSKDKLITVLIYMNPMWDSEGGKLRVLNSKHTLEDYAEEITPLAGACLIFKVTPNCWHGHKVFVGKRLSLQLNYLSHSTALLKHLNQHRFSAKVKQWLPWLNRNSY